MYICEFILKYSVKVISQKYIKPKGNKLSYSYIHWHNLEIYKKPSYISKHI